MNKQQIKEDFIKLFYKYCRDNGIPRTEMRDTIRELDMEISSGESIYSEDSYYNDRSETWEEFSNFHYKLVQECIDFINNNPGIQDKLKSRKKEIEEEWNKDLDDKKLFLSPDIRVDFNITGLDGSLEAGKWSPCSDSYLGICLGNIGIFESL